MVINHETKTLKTKIYGWTVDKTTDYHDNGKKEIWYELIDANEEDPFIMDAFRTLEDAKRWAVVHKCYKYDYKNHSIK